jgi:hypothetical protein
MSSLLCLKTLIDYFDNFSLYQCNGNFAKETEAMPLGVNVVKAWENSGVEVCFMTNDKFVIIFISNRLFSITSLRAP